MGVVFDCFFSLRTCQKENRGRERIIWRGELGLGLLFDELFIFLGIFEIREDWLNFLVFNFVIEGVRLTGKILFQKESLFCYQFLGFSSVVDSWGIEDKL